MINGEHNKSSKACVKREFPSFIIAAHDLLLRFISVKWHSFWTRALLCAYGCCVGRDLKVDGPVVIRMRKRNTIQLGNNVTINSRFCSNLAGLSHPTILECNGNGCIIIGDSSGCSGAVISSLQEIHIGSFVKIGSNVSIFDHDFHPLNYLMRRESAKNKIDVRSAPIVIEDDVFIGAHAIICKGVHVGARTIIGAGAVVRLREIPPDSLVLGNPAVIVKVKKQ
jgi:acetyltransferase-like isoleucine patch superfamily enzyme